MTGDDFFRAIVKAIKRKNGLTNEAFAKRLWVHHNTIPRWTQQPDSVRLYYLREIDKRFGLTDEEIIGIVRGTSDDE